VRTLTRAKLLILFLLIIAEAFAASTVATKITDPRVEYALHSMPADTQLINVVAAKDCVFDQPVIQCPDPETYLQLFARASFRQFSHIHTKEVLLSVNCTLAPLTKTGEGEEYPTANFIFLAPSAARTSAIQAKLNDDMCVPVTEKGYTTYVFPYNHCICLAKPDLIISTDNKLLMDSILSRLDCWWLNRVALPSTLLEWKFVNQRANYWGLRHFSTADSTSPSYDGGGLPSDCHAKGVTFEFADNDHELQMTYLSNNDDRLNLASKLIKDADAWTARHVLVESLNSEATKISVADTRCIPTAIFSVLEWLVPPLASIHEKNRRADRHPNF